MMKYKKLLIIPTLILGLGVVGCDDPDPVHEHVFDQKIISSDHLCNKITCLTPETYYFSCTCGANGTETFEVGEPRGHIQEYSFRSDEINHWIKCFCCDEIFEISEHNLGSVIILEPPTCTETGSGYARCRDCNESVNQVVPATGHIKSDKWSSDENQHWHACENECTQRYDASSHNYGEVIVDRVPTCAAQGRGHKICKDCSYSKEVVLPIDSTAHNLKQEYVPATCTAIAYTHTYCIRCSYELDTPDTTSTIKAHDYDIKITKEANSSSCGTRVCTCNDCGHVEVETIPHTGNHNYRNYVAISEFGHARQCSCEGCDVVEKTVNQHVFSKFVIDREPNGTTPGHRHTECSYCGYHEARSEEDFYGVSIESLAFTVTMPTIGGSFNSNFVTTTNGVLLCDEYCAFFDENSQKVYNREVTSDDIGKTFKAVIYARAKKDYFFNLNDDSVPMITATLNGEPATCPNQYNSGMWSGGEFYYIFTYEFTVE